MTKGKGPEKARERRKEKGHHKFHRENPRKRYFPAEHLYTLASFDLL